MTDVENRLLSLRESRNISRDLLARTIITHHRWPTRMLHVRSWSSFAMLLHLRTEETTRTTGSPHAALRAAGRVRAEIRKKTVRAVDGVRNFRGHGLMERNGTGVALDGVMIALALHLLTLNLLAFTLFPLTVGHLILALALQDLALPRIPLALAVQCLGRRMLHGLADAGKRVAGTV